VELKARFDEESNIGWAQMLEQAGVHVVYGLMGLKTHCKITMVVRKEGDGIRRYLHLATGNYNAVTSRIYEDIGIFTCDEAMGSDVTDLFNYLTGYSTKHDYKKLLVAPVNLRKGLEKLIRHEIEHARAGRKAHLIFKVNSIVDPHIIELLYEASTVDIKFDVLERWLLWIADRPLQHHPAVSLALSRFQADPGLFSSERIAREANMSQRRFIELFRDEVGVTPKLFCRVQRFQNVVNWIAQHVDVDWVDLALAHGYTDQSHFIHDFRAFSGLKPSEYLGLRTDSLNHVRFPE